MEQQDYDDRAYAFIGTILDLDAVIILDKVTGESKKTDIELDAY